MSTDVQVRNPYSGELDYAFADPPPDSIAAACERLRKNQPQWALRPLAERLKILGLFSESIIKHQTDIIAALTADTGRSIVSASEVHTLPLFIQRLKTDAPLALAPTDVRTAGIPIIEGNTVRSPLGLVGNISPWNFPVILSFLDTFPALAAGNAVIIKPSEVTPRWVEPMLKAINDCPEIAQVLDIVIGTGQAGAALIDHVDAVVFTGSVPTGRKVAEVAARNFIPAFLELGGKDPAVVLASADVAVAAETIAFCSCQSTGQACQSIERVYVHESLYDEFVQRVVETAESLQLNNTNIDSGVIGPFIFAAQADKVKEQIDDAVANGANLQCGGDLVEDGGTWMHPAVLTDVTHDMLMMREETFGPVVPITSFSDESEALALANDSDYGLSAAVFAGTLEEARAFGQQIHAGAISLNDAALTAMIHEFEHDSFGFSGLGRSRAGYSAYTRFTREQSIMANTSGQSLLVQQYAQ
jgi:succinate-semialdehyde dehydrogenase/glutarate-semialdehyde dehydrogenase